MRSGVLAELARACGGNGARRAAEPGDCVDGVPPRFVATPSSTEEVAAAMRVARAHHLTVVVRGRGTKLDWGNPPESLDLVLDLSKMDQLLEHAPGDLVVRVEAGMPLARLQEALGRARQWLPVDEVISNSTVGGVLASGTCGPTRMLNGSFADLLTAVTFVRADGIVARSGSKVVKNVAGYNLTRLLTGSFGTLGVVTDLTVRLRPLPERRSFVVASFEDGAALAGPLAALRRAQLALSALEIDRPVSTAPIQLAAQIEGGDAGVTVRAEQAAEYMGTAVTANDPPPGWGSLPGPTTCKVSAPVASVPELVDVVAELSDAHDCPVAVRGSAGVGVVFLGLSELLEAGATARFVTALRDWVGRAGGSAVVLRAPAPVKAALDVWGPVRGLELMRRIKAQFDPDRRLAPGRFVGRI